MAAATGEVGEVRHLSVNKRLLSYVVCLPYRKGNIHEILRLD